MGQPEFRQLADFGRKLKTMNQASKPNIQTPRLELRPRQPKVPTFPAQQPPPSLYPQQIIPAPVFKKPKNKAEIKGLLKLFYFLFFISIFAAFSYFITKKIYADKYQKQAGVLLQTPYQPVTWKDFGEIFEPLLKIPVVYPGQDVKKITFLLDSGALVSSMPREEAKDLGYNSLAKLPRSTFMGFGSKVSFAYKGEMNILLGEKQTTIPVVFTEAGGTKHLLGRSGFFENYSIYFNSKDKRIEVREK